MKTFLVFISISLITLFISCTNSREKETVNDDFIVFDSLLLPIESKPIPPSNVVSFHTVYEIPTQLVGSDSIVLALQYAEDGTYTLDVFRWVYHQPSLNRPRRDYEIKVTELLAGDSSVGWTSSHFNLIDEDKYGLPNFIGGCYFQPIKSGYTELVEISYENKVIVKLKLIPDSLQNPKRYAKLIAWKRVYSPYME